MKTALRPDMWPRAELKLQWFDKLLMTVVRCHMPFRMAQFCHYFAYQSDVFMFHIRLLHQHCWVNSSDSFCFHSHYFKSQILVGVSGFLDQFIFDLHAYVITAASLQLLSEITCSSLSPDLSWLFFGFPIDEHLLESDLSLLFGDRDACCYSSPQESFAYVSVPPIIWSC